MFEAVADLERRRNQRAVVTVRLPPEPQDAALVNGLATAGVDELGAMGVMGTKPDQRPTEGDDA